MLQLGRKREQGLSGTESTRLPLCTLIGLKPSRMQVVIDACALIGNGECIMFDGEESQG